MTRKHFEAIAHTINCLDLDECDTADQAERVRSEIAHEFARLCAQQNPRFNRAGFLEACGVES